ncbi:expressed unknown protein [Seminavis robusta]|uniref:Uncharacterized protein n=1 Tax=Seminavis robusta TaxID=568900 RepID=A0A9N8EL04_9STRA|nr:expressed unknown protein [Seminavis robusta]|eukprot:Sro1386_g268280.1 n/a (242) ;mRNA; f:15121-15846
MTTKMTSPSGSPTTTTSGMTVEELKASLEQSNIRGGLVLDIDETLAATNVAWFERCLHLFGCSKEDTNLNVPQLIDKYHLAQHNPHWNGNPDATQWMHEQREAPEAQDNLPLIPGAVQGVQQLLASNNVNIVGYLTVRPQKVNANTRQWLQESGFPADLPIVAKPDPVPFEQGNQWKAQALHQLWPQVHAIVDDNPKVPTFCGTDYPGTIYLFGRDQVEPAYQWAIPCKTWEDVVTTVRAK